MNAPFLRLSKQFFTSRWLMPLLDVALVFLAFLLGYYMRYQLQIFRPIFDPWSSDFGPYLPYAAFYAVLMVINNQNNGLYRTIRERTWIEEATLIASGVANAIVILLALYFILQPAVTSRLMLIYVAGWTIVLQALARLIRRLILMILRSRGIGVQRVIIAGMGDVGQAVLRTLVARADLGYRVVGYLDDDPQRGQVDLGRVSGLGHLDNLREGIVNHQADMVIITLEWRHYDRILELAQTARQFGVEVRVVPDIFQLNLRQVHVENLDGIPLLGLTQEVALRGANRLLKRALDVSLTILLLPLWLPLFSIVALAIKLDDGGPIFYRATRVGEEGREFEMIKFRSMIPNADQMRAAVIAQAGDDPRHPKPENDPRRTRVGKVIRRLSLDELPNLINVLRGEMSLVGPRPPIPEEVHLYEKWHLQRLQTIPGITGLWQVSGRSDIPFEEMCLMDIYYIENWSLQFDLQILLRTVPKVLLRSGAY